MNSSGWFSQAPREINFTEQSTYDGRLIYKTSDKGHKAFVGYDSLAKIVRSSETVFTNWFMILLREVLPRSKSLS